MFDIGFSELLVIAVVALVVLGPERLPKAARFAGLWVRKARAQWYSVKSEFEREMAADEMRRSLVDPARDLRREVEESGKSLKASLDDARSQASEGLAPAMPATAANDGAAADAPAFELPVPAPNPMANAPDDYFYSDPAPGRAVAGATSPTADASATPAADGNAAPDHDPRQTSLFGDAPPRDPP